VLHTYEFLEGLIVPRVKGINHFIGQESIQSLVMAHMKGWL
jgi:hypothetical protein